MPNFIKYLTDIRAHFTIKKKKGEKPLRVPTFSGDFHFSPNILFLPLLVPILKNASHFGPYSYIRNGNCTAGKQHKLRSLK